MDLLNLLNWRYACKKMNPSKIVDQSKVDNILESIRLAPSSSGLQPYEVLVITNPLIKNKIRRIAWNQNQIVDCSHLLVFAAWDIVTTDRINMMFDLNNQIRGEKNEGWEKYRQWLLQEYPKLTTDQHYQQNSKQAYIGLSFAMIAAAEQGVDCTPMEGFNSDRLDKLLGLNDRGLKSVIIMPLGYRQEELDWAAGLKKVRRLKEQFITEIK